jgi:hypothetical protein
MWNRNIIKKKEYEFDCLKKEIEKHILKMRTIKILEYDNMAHNMFV